MTDTTTVDPESVDQRSRPDKKAARSGGGGLFRTFWRWHFYASFLVIPVLLVLASTGLVYLLRFQIEPLLHADLMKVDVPSSGTRLSYDAQAASLLKAYPDGRIAAVLEPSDADRSTDFSLSTAAPGTPSWEDDTIREVYVNPYTGEVLGELDPNKTVSGYAKNLHSNFMAGDLGAYVMELGACWAIVMAITGYYMYWRGRAARARRKAARAAGAALRHKHATIGLFVGVGLLALVASGLPWTIWWGAKAQELATSQGTSFWSEDPGAQSSAPTLDASVPHSHAVPWGEGKSTVPTSEGTAASRSTADQIGFDGAIETANVRGLHHPMTVIPPADEKGVYSVIGYAFNEPGHESALHIDQFTGKPVAEFGYDQYGALAKVVGQGIALHEGRRFGTANMVVSGLFCVAVMFMCVAGPLMWWRRRPKGASMGAPRGRLSLKAGPVAVVGLIALGVGLPLFGASLVAVFALDQLVLRRVAPLRNFFNVA
ncbi:PepSY-associated TM helix domain-containing protein [Nocardioides cavernaquae]|uniref:PepSY domain-containing protein n=1 Tax=Nocardioides cavernaquae TaxID=2321396 RepID=A0A3A5HCY0_9ACTN|nr:PepSY domain-containing protein [Nocardioides cavernaquae]RJS45864.1 PepSY domain-containing protein [Nocardioides cavernaquae]